MPLEIIEELRQENLADALIERLANESDRRGVLEPATVVVQNAGLGRWLQLRYAKKQGIAAGLEMPFASGIIRDLLEREGVFDDSNHLSTDFIRWLVFQIFVERRFEAWGAVSAPLDSYLQLDHPGLEQRCWQLAGQVAELFDQYVVYRPEWIRLWIRGEALELGDSHWKWQARLVYEMLLMSGLTASAWEKGILGLSAFEFCRKTSNTIRLTASIHVFGVSSLPPLFLNFFRKLAIDNEVVIYHLVSSDAFLGDLARNYREALADVAETHRDHTDLFNLLDNPLLVANGQAAARFQSLLLSLEFPIGDPLSNLEDEPCTDLEALQFSLRRNQSKAVFRQDGSLSFHACHSRMREVQVLQQQLLALFEADASLKPEEVLVMVPEIQDYADAIASVFSLGTKISGAEQLTKIPYCIADKRGLEDESCWLFFNSLIRLLGGQQLFSHVFDILEFGPVCEALHIEDGEKLKEIQDWLQEMGVRWGIDGLEREHQGYPEFEEYSWTYGFDRIFDGILYSGYECGQAAEVSDRRLAAAHVSNSHFFEHMGLLAQLLNAIFKFVRESHRQLPFSIWCVELSKVLNVLLGESDEGVRWLRMIALELGRIQECSTECEISFATLIEILSGLGESSGGPNGLLRRGVTFCRLQPVRHIPARVVCILGMEEGAYPRQTSFVEFDLIHTQQARSAENHEKILHYGELEMLGDRRVRDEDRQLFLDCLLNAREKLYISYVGQDVRNNETIPPSILVSELYQFIRLGMDGEENGASPTDLPLTIKHPLQEWSSENFIYPQPLSGEFPVPIHFDKSLYVRDADGLKPPPVFLEWESAKFKNEGITSEGGSADFHIKDLIRFFKDPAQTYLSGELKIGLEEERWLRIYEDWESFEVDGLDLWKLRQAVWVNWLRSVENEALRSPFRDQFHRESFLSLKIPPGAGGQSIWAAEVEPLLAFLDRSIKGPLKQVRDVFRWDEGAVVTENWIDSTGDLVVFLNGGVKRHYLVEAYLRAIVSGRSGFICSIKEHQVYPFHSMHEADLAEARGWLEKMTVNLRSGHGAPFVFSLGIASDFIQSRLKEPENDWRDLLRAAYLKNWQSYTGPGDASTAQKLCFGAAGPAAENSPWQSVFAENAELVLRPIFEWWKVNQEEEE